MGLLDRARILMGGKLGGVNSRVTTLRSLIANARNPNAEDSVVHKALRALLDEYNGFLGLTDYAKFSEYITSSKTISDKLKKFEDAYARGPVSKEQVRELSRSITSIVKKNVNEILAEQYPEISKLD